MANKVENRSINIFIQSGEAQKALDVLLAKEKLLKEELVKATDPRTVKGLQDAITKLAEPISRATKKVSGELSPSIRDLEGTVRRVGIELKKATDPAQIERLTKEYKQANVALVAQRTQLGLIKQAHTGLINENPFGRMMEFAKGTLLAGGVMGVIQNFTGLVRGSLDEAFEAEAVTKRFKNTLEGIGRIDAFDRLMSKADDFAQRFKYLDNDEVVGVFNKLIDYGKLTEQQMNELLPIIIDFSAKSGMTIAEGTDVMINSLTGRLSPEIKRLGIDFDGAKNEGERLAILMTELKVKVDGAAESFGESTQGKIAALRQQFANLKEELGVKLLPTLNTVLSSLNKLVGSDFSELTQSLKNTWDDIKNITRYGLGGAGGMAIARDARQKQQREHESEQDAIAKKDAERIRKNNEQWEKVHGNKKTDNRLLGTGGGDDKTAPSKTPRTTSASPKIDKEAEDFKKLQKLLEKEAEARALFDATEDEKSLARLNEKYEEMRKLAHSNAIELAKIDKEYFMQVLHLQVISGRKELDELEKQQGEKQKRLVAHADRALQAGERSLQNLGQNIEKADDNRVAGIQLQAIKANGKKRFDLEKQLQDEEKRQALLAKGLTENEKLVIHEQFLQKRAEAEKNFIVSETQQWIDTLATAVNFIGVLNAGKTDQENRELDRDRATNDKKKKNLEARLKSGVLTQLEYDRDLQKIEKEQEKREKEIRLKQFKRDQRTSILKALINGAEAVTKALASYPWPAALIPMAFAAATTIAEVSSIAKRKPPDFAAGGRLNGKPHTAGGMGVYDHYGNRVAEVEGDEGIVNKRTMKDRNKYNLTGTPSQIISLLNARHGGVHWESGARLHPFNFKKINSAIEENRRYYAGGGVFDRPTSGTTAVQADQAEIRETLAHLNHTISELKDRLKQPIQSYVTLSQIESQADRMNRIRDDATMR